MVGHGEEEDGPAPLKAVDVQGRGGQNGSIHQATAKPAPLRSGILGVHVLK